MGCSWQAALNTRFRISPSPQGQSRSFPPHHADLPVLGVGVFEQFSQLQWIFADFLHRSQQKPIQRDVDHLLQQAAGFEEVDVLVDFGEAGELHAGVGVVVAVFRIYLKLCLLQGKWRGLLSVFFRAMAWLQLLCVSSLGRSHSCISWGCLVISILHRLWSQETYSWGWAAYITHYSTCSLSERPRCFHIFWPVLSWTFFMTGSAVADPAVTSKCHSCKLRSSSRLWNPPTFLPKVAWSGRECSSQELRHFENVLSTTTRTRGCLVGRWVVVEQGVVLVVFNLVGWGFLNQASVLSNHFVIPLT